MKSPLGLYHWRLQRWVGDYGPSMLRVTSSGSVRGKDIWDAQRRVHAVYPDRNRSEISLPGA